MNESELDLPASVDTSWVTTESISDWPQGKLGSVMAWLFIVPLTAIPILGGLIVWTLLR